MLLFPSPGLDRGRKGEEAAEEAVGPTRGLDRDVKH